MMLEKNVKKLKESRSGIIFGKCEVCSIKVPSEEHKKYNEKPPRELTLKKWFCDRPLEKIYCFCSKKCSNAVGSEH